MSDHKKGLFVILASEWIDHRQKWYVVPHDELPLWVLDPDVLGRMVNGMVAMNCAEGTAGSLYYRAEVQLGAQDQARLDEALAARELREAKAVLELPFVNRPSDEAFLTIETSELKH